MDLLTALGDGDPDGDGEGLPGVFELELPPGSVAQPAAPIVRAMISPSVVCLMVLISEKFLSD
jgi:hypothetical protein